MIKFGIITRVLRKEKPVDYSRKVIYIEFEKGKDYDVCCTDSKASQKTSCDRIQTHEPDAKATLQQG